MLARHVARTASQAVSRSTPTRCGCLAAKLQCLRSGRTYSTTPPPREDGQDGKSSLFYPAATGFVAGLIFVVANRWRASADSGDIKCDGAPAVDVVEAHGEPWYPAQAYEQDDPRNPMRIRMANWVKSLQDHIVTTIETIESSHNPTATSSTSNPTSSPSSTSTSTFRRDHWIRPSDGGEGSSCVLAGGRVFEKAGVNVSIVQGLMPPRAQQQMRADHSTIPVLDVPIPYFATGLSIVLHPHNPHVPTVHLNYRYFEVMNPDDPTTTTAWWFGGGSDLTPSYLVEEDARHFHTTLKGACDKHDERYWPEYKKWCDKYFYIPHRKESRGVGGMFFDDLNTASTIHAPKTAEGKPPSHEEVFEFVKTASSAFLPGYIPIVLKNKDKPWTEEERRWQLLRRGRYAEFNLVYDRGTKFGLNTPGARIESILMSLPETARWEYMTEMGAEGTKEGDLLEVLRNPKDWA